MKTITIKNLTIQADIFTTHGNLVADAQRAIDLINKALQKDANCLGSAQIIGSNGTTCFIDESDIEEVEQEE
jgi:hypothetical protein